MFTKFKILPVIALGICWMVMSNDASSIDCSTANTRCTDEYKKTTPNGWNACEGYKDAGVAGTGYGLSYIACCINRDVVQKKPWPSVTACTNTPDCTSAALYCDLDQFRTPNGE